MDFLRFILRRHFAGKPVVATSSLSAYWLTHVSFTFLEKKLNTRFYTWLDSYVIGSSLTTDFSYSFKKNGNGRKAYLAFNVEEH